LILLTGDKVTSAALPRAPIDSYVKLLSKN
jgi:hypothetical protein